MLRFDVNIAKYLESSGIGTYAGTGDWGIYAGLEPEKPNNVITVYILPGKVKRSLNQHVGGFFRVHVRVRGNKSSDVSDKSNAIYELLKFSRVIVANSYVYRNIVAITDIMPGGRDKNNRIVQTMNFHGLYNDEEN